MSDTQRVSAATSGTFARDATRASQRRTARAQKACAWCRHRKIKCTGEIPRCKNCEMYEQECVYSEQRRKPRPTNAALEQLREENRRLRVQRSSASSPPVSPFHQDTAAATPLQESPLQHHTSVGQSIAADRTPASASGASTYHGPTSTLFDDAAVSRRDRTWFSAEREELMPKLLLAAAAEQRQMESINLRAGKLDFDGVDPELGLHLLNLHWNRQHHAYHATYRPAFMRDMACGGPYFSKILLNAIYYGASKFSPRLEIRKDPEDVRTAGWRFRDRVRNLLGSSLDQSTIPTIQALLQMTNSLFALGDEQSAAYVYSGIAFRMLIDLGLHVDATTLPGMHRLSDEDIEIRRRIFWSAFVIDKMQSLYQGRPAALVDCQVPVKFLDMYEELEHWQPFAYSNDTHYNGSASHSVSTFSGLCKLCIILTEILDQMYREDRTKRPPVMLEALEKLESKLQAWKTELPTHLDLDLTLPTRAAHIPPPHVLSLLAMWNVLRILLHRPFVSDGHLHSTSPSTAHRSLSACVEAATNIVKLVRFYDHAFSVRRAPYLISYATYVAATVHVRVAAKRDAASQAHRSLKTCLSVLDQNSATNWAVRKASFVVQNLMNRMKVEIGKGESVSEESRPEDHASDQVGEGEIRTPNPLLSSARVNLETSAAEAGPPMDLDIDAIIQSFMQEQRMGSAGRHGLDTDRFAPHPAGDTNDNAANYSWSVGIGGQVLHTSELGNESIDDTLFGFNTSDFDWQYQWPAT